MKKGSGMSLWKQLTVDLLIAAVVLVTFACFHHVLPRNGSVSAPDSSTADTYAPPADTGMEDFSSRFPGKFTDGEVVETASSYISANVNVTYTEQVVDVDGGEAVCHVFDIYVRSCDYFRTSVYENTLSGGYYHRINTLTHAQANNAIAATNGDYCVARDVGVVVRNGTVYRTEPFEDIMVMYTNGTMKTFEEGDYRSIDFNADNVWQVWSFGPALLDGDGEPISRFSSSVSKSNPRTAIGYFEPGHYCLVSVDGRDMGGSEGMTLAELSRFLYDLGCTAAYNLDGGKTSVAVFGNRIVNTPYDGGRGCSDIIYIPRA